MKYVPTIIAISLFSGAALATQSENIHVPVSAKISTEDFQITVPDQSDNWLSNGVLFVRPANSPDLSPVNKQLYMKSTTGGIQAKLLYTPVLTSGASNIEVGVMINSVVLNTTGTEVMDAGAALTGSVVPVVFSAAAAPQGGYVPGHYNGTVSMVFETPAPN